MTEIELICQQCVWRDVLPEGVYLCSKPRCVMDLTSIKFENGNIVKEYTDRLTNKKMVVIAKGR